MDRAIGGWPNAMREGCTVPGNAEHTNRPTKTDNNFLGVNVVYSCFRR